MMDFSGLLLKQRQIKRMISSYVGENQVWNCTALNFAGYSNLFASGWDTDWVVGVSHPGKSHP